MKFKAAVLIFSLLALWALPAQAREYGELVLKKNQLVHGRGFPLNNQCVSLLKIDPDKNVPDMRTFRNFFCTGPYTLYWDGLPDKIVTVYADFNYGKEYGYLILKKTDDKTVWLIDYDDLPANEWIKVPASEDGYGGYEAYYSPGSRFELNFSSVQWGQWWDAPLN